MSICFSIKSFSSSKSQKKRKSLVSMNTNVYFFKKVKSTDLWKGCYLLPQNRLLLHQWKVL